MRTIYDILILILVGATLWCVIDLRKDNQEVWDELGAQSAKIMVASHVANIATSKCQQLQAAIEQPAMDDNREWLKSWFDQRKGRDPFMRMR